jgi:hypothetical protein
MARADPLAPHPNLDFGKGVRGKYYDRMQKGTTIVLIAPDLLDAFPDSESVNEALRGLKKVATRSARPTPRPRKTVRRPIVRTASSSRVGSQPNPQNVYSFRLTQPQGFASLVERRKA